MNALALLQDFAPLHQNELQECTHGLCVRCGNYGQSCTIIVYRAHGIKRSTFIMTSFPTWVYTAGGPSRRGSTNSGGVINGINGAIIAYGHTGSGKTYTILGPAGAAAFA